MPQKIMVVEDYPPLREALVRGLEREGHVVEPHEDGGVALESAIRTPPALVVLDVMLPGLDGFEFLRRLRHALCRSRVLVLTARDAVEDRVEGLDLGADDYLAKPFAFEEFLARARALLRRDEAPADRAVGDLRIDPFNRLVFRGSERVELTPREFAVLELLVAQSGRPVSRSEILRRVFPRSAATGSNVVEVCMSSLRRKLEDRGQSRLITTRRGFGYVLDDGM